MLRAVCEVFLDRWLLTNDLLDELGDVLRGERQMATEEHEEDDPC
jgi:hypothetical protein